MDELKAAYDEFRSREEEFARLTKESFEAKTDSDARIRDARVNHVQAENKLSACISRLGVVGNVAIVDRGLVHIVGNAIGDRRVFHCVAPIWAPPAPEPADLPDVVAPPADEPAADATEPSPGVDAGPDPDDAAGVAALRSTLVSVLSKALGADDLKPITELIGERERNPPTPETSADAISALKVLREIASQLGLRRRLVSRSRDLLEDLLGELVSKSPAVVSCPPVVLADGEASDVYEIPVSIRDPEGGEPREFTTQRFMFYQEIPGQVSMVRVWMSGSNGETGSQVEPIPTPTPTGDPVAASTAETPAAA